MEKLNKTEIAYSAALKRIEKYSADLKEVRSRLKKARLEKEEQKKYLEDIDSDETVLAEKGTLAKSRTREVLEDRITELKSEINYLEEEELRLIALISHEADADQFMQAEMDNIPSGRA
jgi:hypothetical protein